MENTGGHSLNKQFCGTSQKKSNLQAHIDAIRADAEKKIENLEMAASITRDLGYNADEVDPRVFVDALERSARNNGYAGGDSYKPFDPDLAFPTPDGVRAILRRELPKAGYQILEQPNLDLENLANS